MLSDIEIASKAKKKNINKIAKTLGIEDKIIPYGLDKAKIEFNKIDEPRKGKLILVTSINPTPYGEGKTTVSIGLNDALNKVSSSIAVLREPSLGPVFGVKGGATGGGYSQVVPMEDINLHFTGDIHAIESANNLICAAIDNHIYYGNSLEIDTNNITFHRCMDINDRALRTINLTNRTDSFNITAASEIMSIICLSKDIKDLRKKLDKIVIGYSTSGKEITTKDLKITGSLLTLLKDAIKPNLVQSLENNPVIIHGGPFANIALGCNSIIATDLALKLRDYVVTEAGFGSDLGAEKFLDIKCNYGKFKPNCIVIVATIKALKYNAYVPKEDILKENMTALEKGIENLKVHIENMSNYTKNIVVALNKYETDTDSEINYVKEYVESLGYSFELNNSFLQGSSGSINLANKVIEICNKKIDYKRLYNDNDTIYEKIEKICKNIYHSSTINYTENAKSKINKYIEDGHSNLPVCIAKTQYSISDDKKKLGYPKNFELTVKDVNLYAGAGFITIYLADIMTMPGLSRNSNYENIDMDNDGNITGLF